jgi:hypothetical protein
VEDGIGRDDGRQIAEIAFHDHGKPFVQGVLRGKRGRRAGSAQDYSVALRGNGSDGHRSPFLKRRVKFKKIIAAANRTGSREHRWP